MSNYNPSFRSDVRQVTRATGGGSVWFLSLMFGVGGIVWICHALARIPAHTWLILGGGIGIFTLIISAILVVNLIDKANSPEIRELERRQDRLREAQEQWRREHLDLRESDEFTGIW